KIDEINASFAGLVDKQGVAALAAEKAAATMASASGAAAAGIPPPLSTAFKEASELNKGYAGAAKAAAIAEATVNTYVAATKALASVPPPFHYAAGGAGAGGGLAHA